VLVVVVFCATKRSVSAVTALIEVPETVPTMRQRVGETHVGQVYRDALGDVVGIEDDVEPASLPMA